MPAAELRRQDDQQSDTNRSSKDVVGRAGGFKKQGGNRGDEERSEDLSSSG